MTTRYFTIEEAQAGITQFIMNWNNSFIFREEVLDALEYQKRYSQDDPDYQRVEDFLKKLCLESPVRHSMGLTN